MMYDPITVNMNPKTILWYFGIYGDQTGKTNEYKVLNTV